MSPNKLTSTDRVRATAVMLTLVVHGLFPLLLRQEDSDRRRDVLQHPPMAEVWIYLPPAPPPEADEQPASPRNEQAAVDGGISSTITPSAAEQPASPVTPHPVAASPIDWYAEASKQVARAASSPQGAESMGQPVQKMREPCKPRESSFEWSPQEEKFGLLPLPYMLVGERCVIGLGFFGCALGAMPEPNSRLLDDMRKGDAPASSVPTPNTCE